MPLKKAEIEWRNGVPVSNRFDDPYYSLDNGLAETHYVFLDGVSIHDRSETITDRTFVIGETGFGTGLNFLATWRWWQQNRPHQRLTFISSEAYPMNIEDMRQAHAAFPEIEQFGVALRDAWPPSAHGFHPRSFDNGHVRLLLLFGDAADTFSRLHAKIDAWYLDGFAPAKNPDMWTDALFTEMARLSREGAPLATFTAAGFVRRGLEAAGFSMKKAPGYGRKRERLLGNFSGFVDGVTHTNAQHMKVKIPIWAQPAPNVPARTAIVLGGGIAGCSTAYALHTRGLAVTIIESDYEPCNQVSSSTLPAAILAPRFILDPQPERQFFDAAFAYSVAHPSFQSCFQGTRGTEILSQGASGQVRLEKIANTYDWSTDWMHAKAEGLFLEKAGTLAPEHVLQNLRSGCASITAHVEKIERGNTQWRILGANDALIAESDILIIAAGPHSNSLLGKIHPTGLEQPKIHANAGQLVKTTSNVLPHNQNHTLAFGGYISAPIKAKNGEFLRYIGATFDKQETLPETPPPPSAEARNHIILAAKEALPELSLSALSDITQDWWGVRATVPDHLPYCGPIPDWSHLQTLCAPLAQDASKPLEGQLKLEDGLYCLTGLGSKGFQYGPLLGEYLAAMISDEPLPIPEELIARLHPARSMVRDIIRSPSRPKKH